MRFEATWAVFALLCLQFAFSYGALVEKEFDVDIEIRVIEEDEHGSRVRRGLLDKWFDKWRNRGKDKTEEDTTTTTTTTKKPKKVGKGAKKLDLSILMPDGTEQHMELVKRKKFDSPISAHVIRNGELVPDPAPTSDEELSMFGNDDANAFLLMRCNDLECATMGSLYNGTEIYTIEPTDAEPFKGKGKTVSPKAQPKMSDEKIIGRASDGSILPVPFETRKKRDLYLSPSMKASMRARRKRQTTSNMVVELIIIADYSEYLYWLQRANNDAAEAKQIMQMYYILLTNMMDSRFQDLADKKGDSVTFMINDIIYCETDAACPWISNNLVGDVVNVNKALDDVTVWAWPLRSSMKPHDHIIVISKTDLGATINGAFVADPIGVAWTGGMCNSGYSISMIEDPGLGLIDFAATHEIGHSMSSRHDASSGCSDGDYFIMGGVGGSPSVGLSTLNMAGHPFMFSPCAADSIHNFLVGKELCEKEKLLEMNMTGFSPCDADSMQNFLVGLESGSCLLNNNYNATKYAEYKSFFAPGVFLPMDTQCELAMTGGSRRCYGLNKTICSDGAWCWNPADPNWCYRVYPREGTLCAENMRCHKGVCVDSNIVAPTCPPEAYSSISAQQYTGDGGIIVDNGDVTPDFTVTVAPSSGTSYATFESVSAQEIPSADIFC